MYSPNDHEVSIAWHAYACQLQAALQREFRESFSIWRPERPWQLLLDADGPLQMISADALQQLHWSPGNVHCEPSILEELDNRILLAIPIETDFGNRVAAIGYVRESRSAALKIAELFTRCWTLEHTVSATQHDLDICAAQILDDFEELTFLRNLTEQLEACDASQTVWQVAHMVLPLLTPLIQAETIVLVTADHTDDASHEVGVGTPVIWIGPRTVESQTCIRLVQQLKSAAARQPQIRNRVAMTEEGAHFPNVREYILVSLDKGSRTVGWLLALNRTESRYPKPDGARWFVSDLEFGTVEASLLSAVASILATHARNVELIHEKEALLVAVVQALVSALDAKDPYTCGHSERVALVAKRLAEEMCFGTRDCERLYLTGLLHDVGKIGVSDAILRKPGKLTDAEVAEIQRHPDQGWAILQQLDQLEYVFPGVLHHHESFNGTGYPDRLAGEDIPFVARILAVADAYDAMSSDRPYRRGMPHQKVEEILRTGAGTQWDPEVIAAFFRAVEDIRSICKNYRPQPVNARKIIAEIAPDSERVFMPASTP